MKYINLCQVDTYDNNNNNKKNEPNQPLNQGRVRQHQVPGTVTTALSNFKENKK